MKVFGGHIFISGSNLEIEIASMMDTEINIHPDIPDQIRSSVIGLTDQAMVAVVPGIQQVFTVQRGCNSLVAISRIDEPYEKGYDALSCSNIRIASAHGHAEKMIEKYGVYAARAYEMTIGGIKSQSNNKLGGFSVFTEIIPYTEMPDSDKAPMTKAIVISTLYKPRLNDTHSPKESKMTHSEKAFVIHKASDPMMRINHHESKHGSLPISITSTVRSLHSRLWGDQALLVIPESEGILTFKLGDHGDVGFIVLSLDPQDHELTTDKTQTYRDVCPTPAAHNHLIGTIDMVEELNDIELREKLRDAIHNYLITTPAPGNVVFQIKRAVMANGAVAYIFSFVNKTIGKTEDTPREVQVGQGIAPSKSNEYEWKFYSPIRKMRRAVINACRDACVQLSLKSRRDLETFMNETHEDDQTDIYTATFKIAMGEVRDIEFSSRRNNHALLNENNDPMNVGFTAKGREILVKLGMFASINKIATVSQSVLATVGACSGMEREMTFEFTVDGDAITEVTIK